MPGYNSDIAFTPAVKEIQTRKGSRAGYARMEEKGAWRDSVTDELAQFIAERDFFYLGTASADGRPYIQHRGGPKGFLKVLGPKLLGFADYSGNRQYISTGNLSENDRAFLFLMDYAGRRRIKIWGRARVVDDDSDLLASLEDPEYGAKLEQAIVFDVEVWDVNCPQHIVPRYTIDEIETAVLPMLAEKAAQAGELTNAPNT